MTHMKSSREDCAGFLALLYAHRDLGLDFPAAVDWADDNWPEFMIAAATPEMVGWWAENERLRKQFEEEIDTWATLVMGAPPPQAGAPPEAKRAYWEAYAKVEAELDEGFSSDEDDVDFFAP